MKARDHLTTRLTAKLSPHAALLDGWHISPAARCVAEFRVKLEFAKTRAALAAVRAHYDRELAALEDLPAGILRNISRDAVVAQKELRCAPYVAHLNFLAGSIPFSSNHRTGEEIPEAAELN